MALPDLNQDVFIVNRSGGVEWRLSERVSGGNSAGGGAQHGHQLLDNSILIFANSKGSGNASAAIEYTLDGTEMMRYDSGHSTQNLGDVPESGGRSAPAKWEHPGKEARKNNIYN